MSLHDQLQSDLIDSMKRRDKQATSALRMVIAALKNRAVADGLGPQGKLSDEVVTSVLTTEVKRRKEAATAFADAGRADQADSELAEAALYEAYLPTQMEDDELRDLVTRAIADTGASGPQDMGKVMKSVMSQVSGRADGSRVSAMVKQTLAG